ncbi:hypothetical protein ACOMHN_001496 [Nucella lapillus]
MGDSNAVEVNASVQGSADSVHVSGGYSGYSSSSSSSSHGDLFDSDWQAGHHAQIDIAHKLHYASLIVVSVLLVESLHCKIPNVIYCITCRHHQDFLYIGSSVNLRHRWSNHKSDCKLRKGHKCHVAQHFLDKQHPVDPQFTCLRIFAIEAVHKKENLEQLAANGYLSFFTRTGAGEVGPE